MATRVPFPSRLGNVIISIVANFFGRTGFVNRGSTRGETYRTKFEGWAKIVPSIEQLIAAHPYALNWGPLRPNTPRMQGLHPDHPPKRVKKARMNDWI